MQVGSAFIQSGIHKNILIVNGEKLSDCINYEINCPDKLQEHLAAFSFGDAGASALLTATENGSGIFIKNLSPLASIGNYAR